MKKNKTKNARETFEDEVQRWCGWTWTPLTVRLSQAIVQKSTAQHQEVDLVLRVQFWQLTSLLLSSMGNSQSTSSSSSFTAHLLQLSCLFGKKLPSQQTLSLSLSTHEPGMCAQSRKCQTGVGLLDVWLPARVLLCSLTGSLAFEHTLLSGLLSLNTSPAPRSPFTGPG